MFDHRPKPLRGDHWTPEEDGLLRQLAGTMEEAEIARIISERYGTYRTATAVHVRAVRRGISLWAKGMALGHLVEVFGYDHRVIKRWWINTGLLSGRRWSGRGPNEGWWFEPADVETFVRRYPWAYDWKRMKPRHPLTRLAEVVNKADPWLTLQDLASYVGLNISNTARWMRRGLIPHQHRPKSGPGSGLIVIRGRDFRAIKAAIRDAQARALDNAHAASTATRRARCGWKGGPWLQSIAFECARCGRVTWRRVESKQRKTGSVRKRPVVCRRCRESARPEVVRG